MSMPISVSHIEVIGRKLATWPIFSAQFLWFRRPAGGTGKKQRVEILADAQGHDAAAAFSAGLAGHGSMPTLPHPGL
jgi:hypothetical protein